MSGARRRRSDRSPTTRRRPDDPRRRPDDPPVHRRGVAAAMRSSDAGADTPTALRGAARGAADLAAGANAVACAKLREASPRRARGRCARKPRRRRGLALPAATSPAVHVSDLQSSWRIGSKMHETLPRRPGGRRARPRGAAAGRGAAGGFARVPRVELATLADDARDRGLWCCDAGRAPSQRGELRRALPFFWYLRLTARPGRVTE